jgi:hypothetical protein
MALGAILIVVCLLAVLAARHLSRPVICWDTFNRIEYGMTPEEVRDVAGTSHESRILWLSEPSRRGKEMVVERHFWYGADVGFSVDLNKEQGVVHKAFWHGGERQGLFHALMRILGM